MTSPDDDFWGRNLEIESAIDVLSKQQVEKRCLYIEGPAKRGKTKFLQRVAKELQERSAAGSIPNTKVCLLNGADFRFSADDWERRRYTLLAPLWQTVANSIPLAQWPVELAQHLAETTVDESERLLYEARLSPQRIVSSIRTALEQAPLTLFVLMIDALDETDDKILALFEQQVIAPLFSSDLVRLAITRRTNSPIYSLRDWRVRSTESSYELKPFDAAAEQIDALLGPAGSFVDLQKQMKSGYSWGNAGANALLAQSYAAAQPKGISDDAIRDCIKRLMHTPGYTSEEPDDTLVDKLDELLDNHPEIVTEGLKKAKIGTNGQMPHQRNVFSGELQDRGVAYLDPDGVRLKIQRDIAELFFELRKRRGI